MIPLNTLGLARSKCNGKRSVPTLNVAHLSSQSKPNQEKRIRLTIASPLDYLTWADDNDSPRTLKAKFQALEALEKQLNLREEWQRLRVPSPGPSQLKRKISPKIDDSDEDDLYFHRSKPKARPMVEEKENVLTDAPYTDSESESDYFEDESPLKRKKPVKSQKSTTKAVTLKQPKSSVRDLDAPTHTRIPPHPIPSTWCAHIFNPLIESSDKKSCLEVETTDILNHEWLDKCHFSPSKQQQQQVLAIYLDPPLDVTPSTLFSRLKVLLPRIFVNDYGYLFLWTPRHLLADLIRGADTQLGFKYVENLCWIRKGLNNRILEEVNSTATFMSESKQTLLILKRDPQNRIKLRHQRNGDCVFDYATQGRKPDGRVYDVIETLIVAPEGSSSPHLMHLWAGSSPTDRLVYQSRHQWIRILQSSGKSSVCESQKPDTLISSVPIFERDSQEASTRDSILPTSASDSSKLSSTRDPLFLSSDTFSTFISLDELS